MYLDVDSVGINVLDNYNSLWGCVVYRLVKKKGATELNIRWKQKQGKFQLYTYLHGTESLIT
jgi:hypothetical protein